MPDSPAYPLTIFYDGSCSVCAGKMEAYRRREHGGRLLFMDITATGFDPTPYGITLDEFMHEMHAIDRAGRLFRGVEAFRAIWLAFPASRWYGFLAALVALPGLNLLARLAYWSFARVRSNVPSRDACQDGTCRLGRRPR